MTMFERASRFAIAISVGFVVSALLSTSNEPSYVYLVLAIVAVGWEFGVEEGLAASSGWVILIAVKSPSFFFEENATQFSHFASAAAVSMLMLWAIYRYRLAQSRFYRIIEAIPLPAWSASADGIIEYVNRQAAEYAGTSQRDAHNQLNAIIHPDDTSRVWQKWFESIESGQKHEIECRLRRFDGEYRWHLCRALPKLDNKGKIVAWVGTATDIHDFKTATSLLVKQEKLATVGQMIATITHEINNPLEAVGNILFLCREGVKQEYKQYLEMAEVELKRVGEITRGALNLTRGSADPTLFSLSKVVEGLTMLYAPRLRKHNVKVEFQYAADDIAYAVEADIKQVVTNLITNAIDAMPKGGTLIFKTSNTNGRAVLMVADNGCGMDATTTSHLFEQFYTTKRDKGTGLGLWVSKEAVEKNSGNLLCTSSLGVGTEFTISLPTVPSPTLPRANEQALAIQ